MDPADPPVKYGRGRPKKGEIRPPKPGARPPARPTGVGKRPRPGRPPTRPEAALRDARELRALAKRHARELAAAEAAEQRHRAKLSADLRANVGIPLTRDPLANLERMLSLIIQTGEEAIDDRTLSPKERRAELRAIARSAVTLIPANRMLQAERKVRESRDLQERTHADPKMTKAPPTPPGQPGPLQMTAREN